MNYNRVCIICGKEFIAGAPNANLCTDKECRKISKKKYYAEYRKNNSENIKKLAKKHRDLHKEKTKEYYNNNKEKINKYTSNWQKNNKCKLKEYYDNNKEKYAEIRKRYYQKNKRKIIDKNKIYSKENYKEYYSNNKEKIIKRATKYAKNERLINPAYRIRAAISLRISNAIKNKKTKSSLKYIDFTVNELMLHLESKFQEGMTWDNQGLEWHIDHIKPVAAFKLIKDDGELDFEQIKVCWSLDNLQPLWAKDNIIKGSWYEVDGKMCRFSNGEIVEIREDFEYAIS